MEFICLEDISCRISLKSPLFPLARIHSVSPAPMGEILQRGRASWRSVSESYQRQPSLGKLFNKRTPESFSFRLMRLFKDNANLMDVEIHRISIHNSFSRIMLIPWMSGFIVSLPPPPSIKACSVAFDKLVSSIGRIILSEVWEIAVRVFFVFIIKEREACSQSQQALQDICSWSPSQRRIWRQNYGCILLCFLSIIDDYHYGSTLIVLCNDWCWVISFLIDI